MKRIIIDKKTNEVINDFQGNPPEGILTSNAIKAGYKEKDLEEQEVTDEEYNQHVADMKEATRPEREAKENKRKADVDSAKLKLKLSGLNDDELKALFPYL